MSRRLSGLELQGFIKERQARQVRNLRQSDGIIPKLRIIMSQRASEVIQAYVRMKKTLRRRYIDRCRSGNGGAKRAGGCDSPRQR